MSDTILRLPEQESASLPRSNYLNSEHGLVSWLLTQDHKRIAVLYLISLSFFFCTGWSC
jgi:cytochrome c oxidase subunit I